MLVVLEDDLPDVPLPGFDVLELFFEGREVVVHIDLQGLKLGPEDLESVVEVFLVAVDCEGVQHGFLEGGELLLVVLVGFVRFGYVHGVDIQFLVGPGFEEGHELLSRDFVLAFEREGTEVLEFVEVADPDGVCVELGESLEDWKFYEMLDICLLESYVVDS